MVVDSAIRAAVAKVILFTSTHASELKCSGSATLGGGVTSPQHVFLYVFRPGPMLARAHTLANSRMPKSTLFRNLGPPIPLDVDYKFLRYPIRPAPPTCVHCFPVPFARGPGVHGLDLPTLAAVQPYESRDRCVTWPPEGPCPVNLGYTRARGGNLASR